MRTGAHAVLVEPAMELGLEQAVPRSILAHDVVGDVPAPALDLDAVIHPAAAPALRTLVGNLIALPTEDELAARAAPQDLPEFLALHADLANSPCSFLTTNNDRYLYVV